MRRRLAHLVRDMLLTASLLAATPAAAVQPDEVLADPKLEARARALSAELRCMVCQNQSIDDSEAPLARDLRVLLRERLVAGDSDEEVIDFLVTRYGEFVLLKPTVAPHTIFLWATPVVALVIGGAIAVLAYRRRATNATPSQPLDQREHERLKRLLSDES